jgi:hypothetical protein
MSFPNEINNATNNNQNIPSQSQGVNPSSQNTNIGQLSQGQSAEAVGSTDSGHIASIRNAVDRWIRGGSSRSSSTRSFTVSEARPINAMVIRNGTLFSGSADNTIRAWELNTALAPIRIEMEALEDSVLTSKINEEEYKNKANALGDKCKIIEAAWVKNKTIELLKQSV